jgi:uncharacterized protein (TIGR03083 family)
MVDQVALTALSEESRALSAVLQGLDTEDWARLTNCPPWDLQELVVHIGASLGLNGPLPTAEAAGGLMSASDYYRRPERATSAYRQRNVEQTQQFAARVLTATSAVSWFEEVTLDTITTLSGDDPNRVVSISGKGTMRLEEWVVTRVISVAAHGLDIALTLERPAWTVPSALQVMRPVFESLLQQQLPAPLDWDDLTFLAVATGRRALSESERRVLGRSAARFPLLS